MKKYFSLMIIPAILLSACGAKTAAEQTATAVSVPEVKIETIGKQEVEQILEFSGNIEPNVKNMISSAAAQRVEKILVEVGDRVKAGQTLVQMESVNLAQAKIQFENLKLDLSRIEAVYKSGGVAKQQYDQMKAQLDVAQEALNNLEKNTRLLSPTDGVVTQRFFDNGDMVGGQAILVVMQLQPVKISVNVNEEFFPQVKVGMGVTVALDIYPGETFQGKVSLIHPTIDPVAHTFVTEIKIENAQLKIRPGMFARTTLNFGKKQAVVVPDVAVVKQQGTNDRYVYVLNNNSTVSYKKVDLGMRKGNVYEVSSGISEGEKVVVAGMSRLVEGITVKEQK